MGRPARADAGPLAPFADGYRAALGELGYTPDSVVQKLWEVGRLSDWMSANGVDAGRLTAGRVREFVVAHGRVAERSIGPRTLRPLLRYLRGSGVAPDEAVGASLTDALVDRYRLWLVEDRGLAARTVGRYEKTARRFLGSGPRRRAGGAAPRA